MTGYIVVRPEASVPRLQQTAESLNDTINAELESFRDLIDERFSEAAATDLVGALSRRPAVVGRAVHVHPNLWVRPLVLFASMEIARERGMTVEVPEQNFVADPAVGIEIDVYRVPSMAHVDIDDHVLRGRPYGMLPWITRSLVEELIRQLARAGDRLDLQNDAGAWLRMTLCGGDVLLSEENDEGDVFVTGRLAFDDSGVSVAAEAAWAWAGSEAGWADGLTLDTAVASAA